MKKPFKVVLILIGILALLAAGASVAIRYFFPPEKVKALVEKIISEKLHRQVKLGEASVGLFSGLEIDDFQLSESPSFSNGTFISSQRLIVRPRLIPLLSKKIEVKEIELVKPVVTVIRYADGKTYNFSNLTGSTSTTPAPAASAEKSNPFAFLISRAGIEDGHLRFTDQSPAQQSADIDALNVHVKNFTLSAPVDVNASLKIKSKNVAADVNFSGMVSFAGAAKIRKFTVTSGASKISATGDVENILQTDPRVSLNLTLTNVQTNLFTDFAALPVGLKINGTVDGKADLSGTAAQLGFDADLNLDKTAIDDPGTLTKPSQVPLQVSLNGTLENKSNLDLKQAKLTLAGITISADGTVRDLTGTPQLQLKWSSNEFPLGDVQRYLPAAALPAGLKASGSIGLSGSVDGTASSAEFTADGNADKLEIGYSDMFKKSAGVLLRFGAAGRYSAPTAVDFKSIKLSIGQLNLAGSGNYRSGKTSAYAMTFKTERFSLAEVAGWVPMLKPYSLEGGAKLDARIASGSPDIDASGTLTLTDVGLKYEKSQLSQLAATIVFSPDTVSISQLTGQLDGGPLKGSVNGKKLKTHPTIATTLNIQTLDLSKLLADNPAAAAPTGAAAGGGKPAPAPNATATPVPPVPVSPSAASSIASLPMDLSGQLTVTHVKHDYLNADNLDVKWNLTDVTADLSKVNGMSSMKLGSGNISNLQKLTSDSKAAKVVFLPLTLVQKIAKSAGAAGKLPAMDQLPFKSIAGNDTFKSGVMTVAQFLLDSDKFSAEMSGTIGLAGTQPLDLKAAFKLATGLVTGSAGALLQDEQGRPTLNFLVKGTISDPKTSLDTAALEKQTVNALKQGVGSSLLKKFGISLPGGQSPSNEPAPAQAAPADSSQSQPSNQDDGKQKQIQDLQNVFKGLFKK